ncbi:hypothetical protein [Sphingomonas sp. IC081]|uniref:hypothetical protein n=1 Tax=Sphingomonas sp. IC081 TaxID=304378 RepID=UPI00163BA96A|nr:hypothetical protein [Sphingomonas sp. IC081]
MEHHDFRNVIDVVSAGTAVATVAQVLPTAAAVLSIIWTMIRIGEWAALKLRK